MKIGCKIYRFGEVGSTNSIALSEKFAPEPPGTVLLAEKQFSGTGRKGRKWVSPSGGLYYSVILDPAFPLDRYCEFALLAALAIRENLALSETAPDGRFTIKWPNDVYFEDKKICGILLQGKTCGARSRIVIGVGVNVNSRAQDFPAEIRNKITTLADIFGRDFPLRELFDSQLAALEKFYSAFESGRFAEYLPEINGHLYRKDRPTMFNIDGKAREYTIVSVNPGATLKVRDSDSETLDLNIGEIE